MTSPSEPSNHLTVPPQLSECCGTRDGHSTLRQRRPTRPDASVETLQIEPLRRRNDASLRAAWSHVGVEALRRARRHGGKMMRACGPPQRHACCGTATVPRRSGGDDGRDLMQVRRHCVDRAATAGNDASLRAARSNARVEALRRARRHGGKMMRACGTPQRRACRGTATGTRACGPRCVSLTEVGSVSPCLRAARGRVHRILRGAQGRDQPTHPKGTYYRRATDLHSAARDSSQNNRDDRRDSQSRDYLGQFR